MPDPASMGISAWADGSIDGLANLARDEALLSDGGWGARTAVFGETVVSLGVAQRPDPAAGRRARAAGIAVVRRSSGGTGLLHSVGDLSWSIVLPRASAFAGRDYARAYGRLGGGVVAWLAGLGVAARWAPPRPHSESFCLLGRRGEVLVARDRILGGAAQHATSRALLHHGIVNRSLDRARLAELFELPEEVSERELVSLDELGRFGPSDRLADGLLAALVASLARAAAGSD